MLQGLIKTPITKKKKKGPKEQALPPTIQEHREMAASRTNVRPLQDTKPAP
jgi:hypothetical protein